MAKPHIFLFLLFFILPQPCTAFDWGDFHKLAVVFGTILGFGLGFGAIVMVLYIAALRPFFDHFKEEVVQTHRTWHPWPIGSVRWQLQQLVRSGRSSNGKTQFVSSEKQRVADAQNLNVPALQSTFPVGYSYQRTEEIPTIRATEYSVFDQLQPRATSGYLYREHIDRPTYFTPSPEKPIFEEYTITREESFVSRGSMRRPPLLHTDDDNMGGLTVPQDEAANAGGAKIIRTTTTHHSQRSLKTAGSTFI